MDKLRNSLGRKQKLCAKETKNKRLNKMSTCILMKLIPLKCKITLKIQKVMLFLENVKTFLNKNVGNKFPKFSLRDCQHYPSFWLVFKFNLIK